MKIANVTKHLHKHDFCLHTSGCQIRGKFTVNLFLPSVSFNLILNHISISVQKSFSIASTRAMHKIFPHF